MSFFAETDIRTSLRLIIYREGFQEIKVGFDCFTTGAYLTANALMLLQGLLSQFIVFLLIVYSDNIFDLLLNFTAVMFVSHLDKLIFALAFTGYAGKRTEKLSKKIQSIRFPPRYPKGFMKYLHLYLYAMLIVCANIGFGIIARQQTNNKLLDQVVKVCLGTKSILLWVCIRDVTNSNRRTVLVSASSTLRPAENAAKEVFSTAKKNSTRPGCFTRINRSTRVESNPLPPSDRPRNVPRAFNCSIPRSTNGCCRTETQSPVSCFKVSNQKMWTTSVAPSYLNRPERTKNSALSLLLKRTFSAFRELGNSPEISTYY